MFLTGSHDLGKASPCFQKKSQPAVARLVEVGYRFPVNAKAVPHGRVTAIVLRRMLKGLGIQYKVANEIVILVGGHHGVFDGAFVLGRASSRAVGDGLWEESRAWLFNWLAKQLDLAGLPTRHELAGLTLLAGLTTGSDWIASSEEHFPYWPEANDGPPRWDDLLRESKRKAGAALDRLGLRTTLRFPEPLDFQKFFDIREPRPLQRECIRVSKGLDTPFLVIVEAPTGEGKTEAALFLPEDQKQQHRLCGSFIGLPTQATSNQMFTRVAKALSAGASEGIAHLLLLHGHASLSAEFEEIRRTAKTGFVPSSVEPDGCD